MGTDASHAPGAPGAPAYWCPGSKAGVGTAIQEASPVWFTLGRGALEEVYFPGPDHPRVRDCALAVTDGADFFSYEKSDAESITEILEEGVPAYRITNRCKQNRYRIIKEIISHPQRGTVLQKVHFKAEGKQDLQLFVVMNIHLGEQGSGWVAEYRGVPMLFAEGDGVAIALACSAPLIRRSAGFCGVSDGWQDLSRHKKMTWMYERADGGNVTLTGQIDFPVDGKEFLIASGFGFDADAAGMNALAALKDGFEVARKDYFARWKEWQAKLLSLDRQNGQGVNIYRSSTAVLRTHAAKMPPGAMVASLTIPFGQDRVGIDTGGYHLVWPRDLIEIAGGLLAAGEKASVHDIVTFLEATQEPDGHWPQTMWLNGKPYFNGIQMDETAMTVLLLDLARREDALTDADLRRFWPMVKKAVGYLVRNGPFTPEGRWENSSGYSPFTIGAEIGALLIAADMAEDNNEREIAKYLREKADVWNGGIELRTYAIGGALAEKAGVEGYYIRLGKPTGKGGQVESDKVLGDEKDEDLVCPDALALVRFGLRPANDQRMVNTVKAIDKFLKVDLGYGPGWRRYLDDHYGEYPDGHAFDKQGGVGRAWPLFIGERAHFELAAGRFNEAERLLQLMEKTATNTGLISEQTWDADDIPEKDLYRGKPTTSACPLVWAHAEYVKLLRSLKDRKVFDCPQVNLKRYGKGFTRPKKRIWHFHEMIDQIVAGDTLGIEVLAPALIRWSANRWKDVLEAKTRDIGLDLHLADLPTTKIPAGTDIEFTFYWTEADRWENSNFKVTVVKPEKVE